MYDFRPSWHSGTAGGRCGGSAGWAVVVVARRLVVATDAAILTRVAMLVMVRHEQRVPSHARADGLCGGSAGLSVAAEFLRSTLSSERLWFKRRRVHVTGASLVRDFSACEPFGAVATNPLRVSQRTRISMQWEVCTIPRGLLPACRMRAQLGKRSPDGQVSSCRV